MNKGEHFDRVMAGLERALLDLSDATYAAQDANDHDLARGVREIYNKVSSLHDRARQERDRVSSNAN